MDTPHSNLIPFSSSSIASLCPDVLDQILGLWLDAYDQSIARFVCPQWNQILRYHQHKYDDGNDALQVARKKRKTGVPAFSPLPLEDIVEKAARRGHLSILQWLHHHHHILYHGYNNQTSICAYAAERGHLDVLQWLRANGYPWDLWTCVSAAWKGHLDVLQWAHANGCPWDEWACAWAAKRGHLEVLQWAHANGCPCSCPKPTSSQ